MSFTNFPGIATCEEQDAFDRHLASCTVPIVQERGDVADVLGTSTFFRFSGRSFLVTASHVFKGFDPNGVGVPVRSKQHGHVFLTLNGCKLHRPSQEEVDAAIIEVGDPELLKALQNTYSPLCLSDLARHGEAFPAYIIAGYPREVAAKSAGAIFPRAIKITSTEYQGRTDGERDATRDFFLCYARDGFAPDGTTQASVPLHGVSGASVWGVRTHMPQDSVWHAGMVLAVVGIQVACKPSSYIRALRWQAVAQVFRRIDTELGQLLLDQLDVRVTEQDAT